VGKPERAAVARDLLCFGLLGLVALGVFWPMFSNAFVWDDQEFIVKNLAIRNLWPLSRFFQSQGSAAEGAIYPLTGQRPVMVFSLALDYALWRLNPFGYHLTNLLLHLLCVFGITLLAWSLTRSRNAAFLTGSLFALHPGHAEGVIAFLGRSDLLATLFVLIGFWGYYKHREARKGRKIIWYGGSLLSFLLACFSKETGLALLGVLVAYEAFVANDRKSKVVRLVPFVLIGFLYWVYRGRVLGGQSAGSAWWGGSPYTNFLMMFEVYARYLRLLFFPLTLSPLHTVSVPRGFWDGRVLWGMVLLVGSLLGTAWALRRHPWIGLLASWFLIGLVPVANLIPIPGVMILAERWLYLPSLGACALGGWGGWVLYQRARSWTRWGWAGLVTMILVLFGVRTFLWSSPWRTEETIARAIVATSPQSALGYNNLGNALLAKGQTSDAVGAYHQALSLKSDYPEAMSNFSMALTEMGKMDEALQEVSEAIKLRPKLASAHNNLGVILKRRGETQASQAEFREALRLDPDYVEAHYNLGLAFDEAGNLPGATQEYERAIDLNPNSVPSHAVLGILLIHQGKIAEGEKELRLSLRINPDLPEGHNGLGNLLDLQGKAKEAEAEFRLAARLKPDYYAAYYNLGNVLLSQGRPDEAEVEFREALRIQPNLAYAHYNLAVALEDQGRVEEAAQAYEGYLAAAPQAQDRASVEQKVAWLKSKKSEICCFFPLTLPEFSVIIYELEKKGGMLKGD